MTKLSHVKAQAPLLHPPGRQAEALALEAAGMPGAVVAESSLRIAFDSVGGQKLVWSIVIQGTSGPIVSAAFVDVDAISGVAVVTGRG